MHSVAPQLDVLMLFGFLSAFLAIVFLIERHQTRSALFPLAACLAATAVYGFLQSAWPLGIIQMVWAAMTFRQALRRRNNRTVTLQLRAPFIAATPTVYRSESRISRLFGPM
jgi:hypothetical protein